MSLYFEYIKEKYNKNSVETQHGFATYIINNEECYIEDIYVKPEHRKLGLASKLADQIALIGKEKGCKYLTGSVVPSTIGSTESLKVLLAYGFKLMCAKENVIWLVKEI